MPKHLSQQQQVKLTELDNNIIKIKHNKNKLCFFSFFLLEIKRHLLLCCRTIPEQYVYLKALAKSSIFYWKSNSLFLRSGDVKYDFAYSKKK